VIRRAPPSVGRAQGKRLGTISRMRSEEALGRGSRSARRRRTAPAVRPMQVAQPAAAATSDRMPHAAEHRPNLGRPRDRCRLHSRRNAPRTLARSSAGPLRDHHRSVRPIAWSFPSGMSSMCAGRRQPCLGIAASACRTTPMRRIAW
jgi:hypothetical protein